MNKIEDTLWQRYKQTANSEREWFDKLSKVEITVDEWIENRPTDVMHELRELCAKSYSDKMAKFPDRDWVKLYFEDIREATDKDNLDMLYVWDYAPTQFPIIVPVEVDEFLLNYYLDFFKRATDQYDIRNAQILFEQVLDTSENELDIYTRLIDEIFSMDKGEAWFIDFYYGIWKLLIRAPVNQKTLEAMKKGLTGTGADIIEEIEEQMSYRYEMGREISVLKIQQQQTDIIALLHFQDGAIPEIGRDLKNDEVTCRIKDFEMNDFGLYNCTMTVIEGTLTEDCIFDVRIKG